MDELKGIQIAKDLIKNFLVSEYEHEESEIKFNDISHIPIAYTQTEDGEHDIDVVVDLKNYSINKHLDGTVVESITSENIHELISKKLTTLDFSDLVYLDFRIIEKFKEHDLNTLKNKNIKGENNMHKDFTYESFKEYVINKMSKIYEQDGNYGIISDTQPLEGFGKLTEEDTLKHIYDNKLFDELNKIITQATIPYKYREAYGKLNPSNSNLDNNTLKTGDILKTGANDNTLVLKVKDNDAILFTGNQFVVAHGIQKDGNRAYWAYGDYYNELSEDIFNKSEIIQDRLKEEIISLVDRAYNKIDKVLTDDNKEYIEYRVAQGLDDILEIKRILEEKEITLEDDWELEP